jgi:hypothetical protein
MEFRTFYNHAKRTVAVKIVDAAEEFDQELYDFYYKMHMKPDYTFIRGFFERHAKEINNIVGIATCNTDAGDTYDSEIGRRIARERSLYVFEGIRARMYEELEEYLEVMAAEAVRRQMNAHLRRGKRKHNVSEIIARG